MQWCKGRRTLNNAFNALIFNNHMYLMHKKTGEREENNHRKQHNKRGTFNFFSRNITQLALLKAKSTEKGEETQSMQKWNKRKARHNGEDKPAERGWRWFCSSSSTFSSGNRMKKVLRQWFCVSYGKEQGFNYLGDGRKAEELERYVVKK